MNTSFLAFLQQWIKQRLAILRFLVVIFVFALVGYVWLWPQVLATQVDHQELQRVELALQNRGTYLQRLKNMEANYEQLDKTVFAILSDVLPEQTLPTDIFPEIERAFTSVGFSIQSINVSDAPAESANSRSAADSLVDTVNITVNAQAPTVDYDKFKELLRSLEEQRRIFDVQSINYSADTSAFTFVIHTYVTKQ